MANILIEARLDSLPGRQILLNFKFINRDNADYYFDITHVCSRYYRMLRVNNTRYALYSLDGWIKCTSTCSPPPSPENIVQLSAGGVFEKAFDVARICSFLYSEPLGKEHYLKYTPVGLPLSDLSGKRIDYAVMPMLELPFILIDKEYEEDEEEIETIELEEMIGVTSSMLSHGEAALLS